MTIAGLSEEDRKKGLEKAHMVRRKRAEIKNSLKSGETNMKKLFKDNDFFNEYISSMKVSTIISSLPGNGKVHAINILKDLKISPNKKIGGLGKNQKENFYRYFKII